MTEDRAFFLQRGFYCPRCGVKLDAAAHCEGKDLAPEKGDNALCVGCGLVMVFDDRFTIRQATPNEEAEILRDEGIRHMRDAILWANELDQ